MEIRNSRDVAAQVMTKPDQEGLIVRNVVNEEAPGARRIILLSSKLPPGKVHLLHRHPNAEQIQRGWPRCKHVSAFLPEVLTC